MFKSLNSCEQMILFQIELSFPEVVEYMNKITDTRRKYVSKEIVIE